jgi:hypothetical protein
MLLYYQISFYCQVAELHNQEGVIPLREELEGTDLVGVHFFSVLLLEASGSLAQLLRVRSPLFQHWLPIANRVLSVGVGRFSH